MMISSPMCTDYLAREPILRWTGLGGAVLVVVGAVLPFREHPTTDELPRTVPVGGVEGWEAVALAAVVAVAVVASLAGSRRFAPGLLAGSGLAAVLWMGAALGVALDPPQAPALGPSLWLAGGMAWTVGGAAALPGGRPALGAVVAGAVLLAVGAVIAGLLPGAPVAGQALWLAGGIVLVVAVATLLARTSERSPEAGPGALTAWASVVGGAAYGAAFLLPLATLRRPPAAGASFAGINLDLPWPAVAIEGLLPAAVMVPAVVVGLRALGGRTLGPAGAGGLVALGIHGVTLLGSVLLLATFRPNLSPTPAIFLGLVGALLVLAAGAMALRPVPVEATSGS